jgi:alkylation response protein AidB-like acyl-CoA dehydrogenase
MQDTIAGIAAAAEQHDRDGSFPHANFAALQAAGLLALTVPTRFGGQGRGLVEAAHLVRDIGRACPSTALVLSMQLLHHHAIETNKRWPASVAEMVARAAVERGALINSFRVEPELGTPARGGMPATVARRTAQGWALSGRKIYATGAPGLTWGVVWARTDEAEPRLGSFLLPLATPGVRIVATWDHLGLRASGSHDVAMEDAAIPEDHAVDVRPPAQWRGREGAQAAWNVTLISAVYAGVAEAARDWLRHFLRTRAPSNLGAALATLPRMQEAMGRIEARLLVNDRLLTLLAADVDAGRAADLTQVDLFKTVISDNVIEAVQEAVALCGNHALARANPLERHLRDVLCARIHTPQADSAYVAAGRARLGV